LNSSPCAWSGTVGDFLAVSETEILGALTHHLRETGPPQLFAWRDSLRALRDGLGACLPEAADCGLVLEYELPRSGGRRPDLIFLNNGIVLVIEFKNRVAPEAADFDQVLGYVRDLSEYHAGCRDKRLVPVLVPVGFQGAPFEEQGVRTAAPKDLVRIIKEISAHPRKQSPDTGRWVQSSYEPLPALVEAARLLFERKPLPRIRAAEAENIPARVERVEFLANAAIDRKERRLILITGVPGSGKTLIGLQTAYSRNLNAPAVLLSGNGPLVSVLQYVLNSAAFVQSLKNYLRDILIRQKRPPREQVVIFDEAQRAWDRDRVFEKHRGDLVDSEPALLLSLANRIEGGHVVVALMGEGQEIHAGEESGIQNWVDAVQGSKGWSVSGPRHLERAFTDAGIPYDVEPLFNLTTSLRSRKAGQLSAWAELMLGGRMDEARAIAVDLTRIGYPIRMSRNFETVKAYIRDRFDGVAEKRTGAIASSKFRKLAPYGISAAPQNFYYYGQWYEEPESHPKSGGRFETAITEFGCQGLELDLPVLCWGPDLRWEGDRWVSHLGRARVVRNPHQLRLNAYRVLLTRGRDGLAIFVPGMAELDGTWERFRLCGVLEI